MGSDIPTVIMLELLIYATLFTVGTFAADLFQMTRSTSQEICCQDSHVSSCFDVTVDPEALLFEGELTINGIDFLFSNEIPPNGFVYKNSLADEAVISYNENSGNMFGTLKTHDGRSYAIERCNEGHVWKEFDVSSFGPDEAESMPAPESRSAPDTSASDNTTMVTYSVYFYYTPEVAASTADIPGFINQILSETNQGYSQSGIALTITTHCIEQASINDDESSSTLLTNFRNMKGDEETLRGTADAAALIYEDSSGCGRAYLYAYSNQLSLSITKKSCATGYYSFGHEIGHNLGATHNPEESTNSVFDHGHAHLILPTSAAQWDGYRTILAYNAFGHYNRVNYYSNPSVIFPTTGTATGVVGVSNNAAVLNQNRAAYAALGDESQACSAGATTTTTSAPTTTTAAPPVGGPSCQPGKQPYFQMLQRIKKVKSWADCRDKCNNHSDCEYWRWKDNKKVAKRQCYLLKVGYRAKNGWSSGAKYCS